MKKITLYHGSKNIMQKPIFGFGKETNDYGRGFYCTESEDLSKEWACQDNTPGISNKYRIDIDGLRVLDLEKVKEPILSWVAILLKNRQTDISTDLEMYRKRKMIERYLIDTSEYDVVTGYRADDSYFSYAKMFLDGGMTDETLSDSLHLGNFGIQFVLISEKAFDRIEFISSEQVDPKVYHPKFTEREKRANDAYRDLALHTNRRPRGHTIDHFLEERQ